jgi:hypothetical protein
LSERQSQDGYAESFYKSDPAMPWLIVRRESQRPIGSNAGYQAGVLDLASERWSVAVDACGGGGRIGEGWVKRRQSGRKRGGRAVEKIPCVQDCVRAVARYSPPSPS